MAEHRESTQWGFAPFSLDIANVCLWRGGQRIALRPKTYAVLVALVTQAGQLVTKEALLEAVWPDTAVGDDVLKASIRELRQVLGETAKTPRFIATEHRRGYRFIAPVTTTPTPTALPPEEPSGQPAYSVRFPLCVGREAELAQLHAHYAAALQGERQFIVVTGEAGIGKTTLSDTFTKQLGQGVWLGEGQCMEQYGAGEAYLPILLALGQLCRTPDGAPWIDLLQQQAPSWLLHMPALISTGVYDTLQKRHGGALRERMLRELAEAMEAMAARRPVVLVFEDLHWSDASTLDWLAYIARRRTPAQLFILGTYRPTEAQVHTHPIYRLTQELALHGHCVELHVPYLSEAGVGAYLRRRFGTSLESLVPVLHQRTRGNPLFLVTMLDAIIEQGALQEQEQGWVLTNSQAPVDVSTPESLRHLIEQHFEQLATQDQSLLEAASAVGREFAAALVRAGSDTAHEDVERRCTALARQGRFIEAYGTEEWPDGTVTARYRFIQDFYREVIYGRLPISQQIRLHRHIGLQLEASYGPQARSIAVELARHFVRGHDTLQAVRYLQYAGEQAIARSAYQEAIMHFQHALQMLQKLPDRLERSRQEILLQTALGPPLIATKGPATPEVEQTYLRLQALCTQVSDRSHHLSALQGLWRFYHSRGVLRTAREFAEQLYHLTPPAAGPALLLEAHEALGQTLFFLGDYSAAWEHFAQGNALIETVMQQAQSLPHGVMPGVRCSILGANALWSLGLSAQAMHLSQAAMTLAQASVHPHSLAIALHFAAYLYRCRGEAPEVQVQAEALLKLSEANGFPLYASYGLCWQGWALALQGQGEVGLVQIKQGMQAVLATGQTLSRPFCCVLLAEAAGHSGQPEMGLRLLSDVLTSLAESGRGDLLPETYRLQGELLLQQSHLKTSQAEACFQQALTIACQQRARSWELRAAMSLSRLWHQQKQHQQALRVLEGVYHGFSEGFETQDLQMARALLQEFSGSLEKTP